MRCVLYCYDIPKNTTPEEYPNPGTVLRAFGVHIQQSVWILPEAMLPRTDDLTSDIKSVGGSVDVFEFDEAGYDKIRAKALMCIQADVERLRQYVEASVAKTRERLEEARAAMSINETNNAIRFQQTALSRAQRELNDAEECAVAFDLSGEVAELIRSVRSVIAARADAFCAEKDAARAAVRGSNAPTAEDGDPAALGFGLSGDVAASAKPSGGNG